MTAVDSETLTRGYKTVQNGSIKFKKKTRKPRGVLVPAAQCKDVTHFAAFWIYLPLLTFLCCSFPGLVDKHTFIVPERAISIRFLATIILRAISM